MSALLAGLWHICRVLSQLKHCCSPIHFCNTLRQQAGRVKHRAGIALQHCNT